MKNKHKRIILKQKEQEKKASENELSEIIKETDKIKRENQQQIKNSNRKREKHRNNKKVARREGYPGVANVRSKNSKPESRNKPTQTPKQRNPANRTEGNKETTHRQYRPGKRKERKY